MQSLDVSHCEKMDEGGLQALARFPQLTALKANKIGVAYDKHQEWGSVTAVPNFQRLLTYLTGDSLVR